MTYCASYLTSLLLGALASITHHTAITANLALLEQSKHERQEAKTEETAVKPVAKDVTGKIMGKWVCPDCGKALPGDVIRCNCGFKREK